MATDGAAKVLRLFRDSGLLEPDQVEELSRLAEAGGTDPKQLAKLARQRGWLTRYQINQIVAGRGADLLLEPYVLLEPLGEGGMGQVFRARHRHMNRVAALKVIRKEKLANPESVRRFYQEIQSAAQLAHPNIVLAYDANKVGTTHFFAMEFVEGVDLGKLVKEKGSLTVAEACECVRQAALGLQHAYERGLVHRDIKPANILLSPKSRLQGARPEENPAPTLDSGGPTAKIADFGLARFGNGSTGDNALTQEGKVMGTPDYLAPEQALDAHNADIRSDLYSLGCTFYFLLAGRPPFRGASLTEVLLKHQMEEPPALATLRPDVPPAVAAIVARLMAKRPEDRFQTPAELAAALQPYCQSAPVGAAASAAAQAPNYVAAPSAFLDLSGAANNEQPEDPDELTDVGEATFSQTPSPVLRPVMARTRARARKRKMLIIAGFVVGGVLHLAAFTWIGLWLLGKWQPNNGSESSDEIQIVAAPTAKDPSHRPATPPRKVGDPVGPGKPPVDSPSGRVIIPPVIPVGTTPAAVARGMGSVYGYHLGPVRCLAFSRDGRHFLSGGDDTKARLVNLETGQQERVLTGHTSTVWALDLSADGRHAVTASADGTVRLWDLESGQEESSFEPRQGRFPASYAVAFSPDGRTVVTGGVDKLLRLWDVATGKGVRQYEGHAGAIYSVAFSPDGRRILSGGTDQAVRTWDCEKATLLHTLPGQAGGAINVASSADGQFVLTGDRAGQVRLYPAGTNQEKWKWQAPPGPAGRARGLKTVSAALSADGRHAFAGGPDGYLYWWDVPGNKLLGTFPRHDDAITCLALTPDSSCVVTGGQDRMVRVWPVAHLTRTAPGSPPPAPGSPPPVKPPPQVVKSPVPEADKQADAEKVIKDLFKAEYARTKPADKLELSAKLYRKALETADQPVARFVLLREARELAAQAGDVAGVVAAIDETARGYAVDALDLKVKALTAAAQSAVTLAAHKTVVDAFLSLVDDAVAADAFEAGIALMEQAEASARKAASPPLVAQVQARAREVRDLQKEYEAMKAATEVLARTPNDPEANLAVGKYQCLRKGDWAKGLPRLVKGSDAALQAAARKDAAGPRDPAAQTEVADAWWDLSEADAGSTKAAFQARALHWYKQAVADGLSGLSLTRVEKRVTQLDQALRRRLPDIVGEVRRLTGHTARVNAVALSRDGRWAVSGAADGAVILWETETGKQLRQFPYTGEVRAVALSSDDKMVVATGKGGLSLWDAESGRVMGNQSFLAGSTLSLSSDAARIAVGTAPSTLHIYDVEEKRAFVNYPLGSLVANLRGLAFARDKSHLLFVAGDGSLHVFDYLDLKEGGGLGKRLSFALTCVAVSPLGTEYVTGGEDKLVRFWDMATGKELREAKGHTERVNAVAFGPDRRAVSASDDKTVRLWDAKTGHELQRFTWHTDAVTSVAISADGRYAISGGADKTVRLWGLPK